MVRLFFTILFASMIGANGCSGSGGGEDVPAGGDQGKDAVMLQDQAVQDQAVQDQADEPDTAGKLEIAGSWVDDFGGTHQITNETWTMGGQVEGIFHIVAFDNLSDRLIAHNDTGNAFSPDKWSVFDWTWYQDDLYFCQTVYDADTREQAESAEAADPSDPTVGGCGGFAWSRLLPAE